MAQISTISHSATITADESGGALGESFLLASGTLLWREMVRFWREKSRVVSALITPVLIWLGLSFGFKSFHFHQPGVEATSYMQYLFPGTITMILLFTAIFSTITVIEDRREGFLQGVLVSPASRLSIVMGKILGGSALALIPGIIFLALWPLVASHFTVAEFFAGLGVMIILAIAMTGLGLSIAWVMDSTAGFHAVMMLLLMPLWFLSGAMFPLATAPLPMKVLMYADPLTYGQSALSGVLHGSLGDALLVPGDIAWPVMTAFTIAMVALAAHLASRPRRDGT